MTLAEAFQTRSGTERKAASTRIEWKAEREGTFRAVFATLGVVDRDGDVTLPGAFKEGQDVAIAAWGHNWGDLPVGQGVIHANEKEAWVDGEFFLDTPQGAAHYKTIRRRGEQQQWSYGFDVLRSRFGEQEGREVRYLEALDVWECSPVMVGAGFNTRTTAIKDGGMTLADEIEHGLAAVQSVTARVRSLADLRAKERKEGRAISTARRERLNALAAAMRDSLADLEKMLAETDVEAPKALSESLRLRSEFTTLRSRLRRDLPHATLA